MLPLLTATASGASEDPIVMELAGSAKWLKLGHYEHDGGAPDGWRSSIHAGDFFLAAGGDKDPEAELSATIEAMGSDPAADADQHAQCRFPARLLWLRQQLRGRVEFRNDIHCPAFAEWTRSGSVSSVSVVLASGFLGNPASYYGHTLLKFNYSDSDTQTSLLDQSASFGAIDEGRPDNPLVYIVKSLLHGYDAGFSHIRFYFHDHHYGNEELRDLWEYRLNLSEQARDLIVAHTWEILGKRYTYEFFHGNCALRMAEVVELADGVDIAPRGRPWVVPQALTARLAQASYQGHPLVSDIIYHPSRQSRFYRKYLELTADERRLLHDVVHGKTHMQDAAFASLSVRSQQAVLDTLLDYHQFVDNPVEKAPEEAREKYNTALSQRFQLPPGELQLPANAPSAPHGAHAPGWIQGSWMHNDATGDFWSLRVRATYYDTLDFDASHGRFSSLAMGDLQLDLLDQRLRVNRFDLVRVESVKPGISGLPGDRGGAWKLGLGATQARLACRNCLAARFQGDMGYTWRPQRSLLLGTYAGGAVQTEAAGQGWGFGRAAGTLNLDLGRALRARVEYEYRVPVGSAADPYGIAQAELRWGWNNQRDLRIRYIRDRADEIGLGLGFYW
jgi:hypothetical protein